MLAQLPVYVDQLPDSDPEGDDGNEDEFDQNDVHAMFSSVQRRG